MVESKAWDWTLDNGQKWLTPSQESYWLANRWVDEGFINLLDLGSGLGRHSILFASRRFKVSSFDLSSDGIEHLNDWADSEGLKVETTVGDMMQLSYPDRKFDCLFAFHVIYHTDTTGIKQVINEIRRVLRPGGEFYITFMSKQGWTYSKSGYPKLDENTVLKTEDGPEKDVPHFCVDYTLIKELFTGFNLVEVRQVEDIDLDSNGSSWHYHVLGRRI